VHLGKYIGAMEKVAGTIRVHDAFRRHMQRGQRVHPVVLFVPDHAALTQRNTRDAATLVAQQADWFLRHHD
jgi:hypothetical protein